jgi:hypothetical protein
MVAGTCSLLFGTAALAGDFEGGMTVSQRYPEGSIRTLEEAEQALAHVRATREIVRQRFESDQQACNRKFLATACTLDAKDRRRAELLEIRRVEVEANQAKRRLKVAERDRAAALREEREADAGNGLQVAVDGIPQNEARDATNQGQIDPRVAVHEEKKKIRAARDAADEERRKKNIAAYEKKQREARERLLTVSEKETGK